ncbi:DNA polymerase V subunit UmuC [Brenneria alni]|uniref:DNA polymerase V subunit UmuC n=1 Tax=Brenneria alni TaxID=71656 RepID=A0A421DJJ0_9GAMM|nr:translesion error-prone DNA polymerase V subunit UmuC [Brenneria alni]RLM18807.1 DNA polymerase V subunit UmuC [Brenneria alni]
MFAHVDVNNFYASCEAVFRPDLKGQPVIVLSNNDGCVIARNREAKALGIGMGAPFFKIENVQRRYGVQVFSSNYALYADMSGRVMATLETMAPALEIYSIDEAFMHIGGIANCVPLAQFGHDVRAQVRQYTHLTVGVGIAPTKTLAKLANYAAKKWSKTGGVVDLSCTTRQRKLLALAPVEEVWGVGRRISKALHQMGIETALHLADSSPWVVRKHFNVVLERTMRELRGEPCLALEEFAPVKQQIVCSRSFGSRITRYEDMRQAVCAYAGRAAEKLREERQYCRHVSVFVRTSPHSADGVFYANQASGTLTIPSNDTRDIVRVATTALDGIWRDGYRYMKAGVMLGDFFNQGVAQLNLFDAHGPRAGSDALMHVLDAINQSGKGKVWFAGQGMKQPWQMKRERLSPAYTTRFTDLPVAI